MSYFYTNSKMPVANRNFTNEFYYLDRSENDTSDFNDLLLRLHWHENPENGNYPGYFVHFLNGSDNSIIQIISGALSGVTINLSNGYVWPGYVLADLESDSDEIINSINANNQLEEQNFENTVILLSNRVLAESEAQTYSNKGVIFLQETIELFGLATSLKIAKSSMKIYEKNWNRHKWISDYQLDFIPVDNIEKSGILFFDNVKCLNYDCHNFAWLDEAYAYCYENNQTESSSSSFDYFRFFDKDQPLLFKNNWSEKHPSKPGWIRDLPSVSSNGNTCYLVLYRFAAANHNEGGRMKIIKLENISLNQTFILPKVERLESFLVKTSKEGSVNLLESNKDIFFRPAFNEALENSANGFPRWLVHNTFNFHYNVQLYDFEFDPFEIYQDGNYLENVGNNFTNFESSGINNIYFQRMVAIYLSKNDTNVPKFLHQFSFEGQHASYEFSSGGPFLEFEIEPRFIEMEPSLGNNNHLALPQLYGSSFAVNISFEVGKEYSDRNTSCLILSDQDFTKSNRFNHKSIVSGFGYTKIFDYEATIENITLTFREDTELQKILSLSDNLQTLVVKLTNQNQEEVYEVPSEKMMILNTLERIILPNFYFGYFPDNMKYMTFYLKKSENDEKIYPIYEFPLFLSNVENQVQLQNIDAQPYGISFQIFKPDDFFEMAIPFLNTYYDIKLIDMNNNQTLCENLNFRHDQNQNNQRFGKSQSCDVLYPWGGNLEIQVTAKPDNMALDLPKDYYSWENQNENEGVETQIHLLTASIKNIPVVKTKCSWAQTPYWTSIISQTIKFTINNIYADLYLEIFRIQEDQEQVVTHTYTHMKDQSRYNNSLSFTHQLYNDFDYKFKACHPDDDPEYCIFADLSRVPKEDAVEANQNQGSSSDLTTNESLRSPISDSTFLLDTTTINSIATTHENEVTSIAVPSSTQIPTTIPLSSSKIDSTTSTNSATTNSILELPTSTVSILQQDFSNLSLSDISTITDNLLTLIPQPQINSTDPIDYSQLNQVQEVVQNSLNSILSDASNMTTAEIKNVFTGLASVIEKTTSAGMPSSEGISDSLKGISVADQDSLNLSYEELQNQQKTNQKRLMENMRSSKNDTLKLLRNAADMAKQMATVLLNNPTNSTGNSVDAVISGNSIIAAISNDTANFDGINLQQEGNSSMTVTKSNTPLIVNKRDAALDSVVNMQFSSNSVSMQLRQNNQDINNDRKRKKRDARKKRSLNSSDDPENQSNQNSVVVDQLNNNSTHFNGQMAISSFKTNTKNSGVILVIEPQLLYKQVGIEVYIKVGSQPTLEDYDLNFMLPHDLDIWDMNEEYDNWKIFLDQEVVRSYATKLYSQPSDVIENGDTWYIGVIRSSLDFDAVISIATPACRTFNQDTEKWESGNCVLGPRTNLVDVECICTNPDSSNPTSDALTVATEFFAPPNSIDFDSVFQKFDLNDNPAVFATIIAFFVLYLLVLFCGTIHWDRQDIRKWALTQLADNYRYSERRSVMYQISISTGSMPYAGTESEVCFQFYSDVDNVRTRPRLIKSGKDNKKIVFPRGTIKNVLMREKNIKKFSHLHVWHDNSGPGRSASWFCDQIIVKNLFTGQVTYFPCKDWLAVDQGKTLQVDRVIPAEQKDKAEDSFKNFFNASLWTKLIDDHLWLSVFIRGFKSSFNRTQRWTCCFVLVFITFVANCMWFETGKRQDPIIVIGPFEMSTAQIWASIASALVAIPPIILIVLLFQRTESKEQHLYRKLRAQIEDIRQNTFHQYGTKNPYDGALNQVNLNGNPDSRTSTADSQTSNVSETPYYNTPKNRHGNKNTSTISAKFNRRLNMMKINPINNDYDVNDSTIASIIDSDNFSDIGTPNSRSNSISSSGGKTKKRSNQSCNNWYLPRWTVGLWYLLAWLAMIISAFFTILYSMEFGKAKSERWLTNALVSFVLDILIIQPIKVTLIVIALGVFFRKLSNVSSMLNSVHKYEIISCVENENPDKFQNGGGLQRKFAINNQTKAANTNSEQTNANLPRIPKPPSKKAVQQARWRRENEKNMNKILWEALLHILYVIVLAILVSLLRGKYQYNWVSELLESFEPEDVEDVGSFWEWIDETMIPEIYNEYDYLGDRLNWRERKFLSDRASYRVGPVRLRQIRRMPNSCREDSSWAINYSNNFGENLPSNRTPCQQKNTEQMAIKAGSWYNQILSPQEIEWAFEDGDLWELAWIYQNQEDLRGVPYKGLLDFYSGDGYSAELGVNLMTGLYLSNQLKEAAWIDGYTKVVFLEFTLYSSSANLFNTIVYAFEFPEFAGTSLFSSQYTSAYQVYSMTGDQALVLFICQLIFVIHLVGNFINLMVNFKKEGIVRFIKGGFWNLVDVVVVVLDILAVIFYVLREIKMRSTLDQFHFDEGRRFTNFSYNALISQSLISVLAFCSFFSILYILKILRFNQKVGLLSLILKTAGRSMGGMIITFGIAMVAHAWVLTMLFQNNFEKYRNLPNTLFNMFTFMLGDGQYDDMMEYNKNNLNDVIGKIIVFSFSVIMIIFVLNFIISVIDAGMSVSREDNMKVNGKDYELANFMWKKFKMYFEGVDDLPDNYKNILKNKNQRKLDELKRISDKLEENVGQLEGKINMYLAEAISEV